MPHRALRTAGAMVVLLVIGGLAAYELFPRQAGADIQEVASPAAAPTTKAGPEAQVDEAFTYTVGMLSSVTTDNFWAFYGREASVWNAYVLGPTKPALFTLNPTTGALEPEVAIEMAEPERNGGTWTVSLRLNDSLSWSDGTPITAHDFAYTFETVRSLELGGSWEAAFPREIVAVTAASQFELEITFSARPTLAAWPHSVGVAPIMPSHVWRDITKDATAQDLYAGAGLGDVAGGPLEVLSITEHEIVSAANPGYGIGTHPDKVIYRVFASQDEAVEALGAGRIDAILSPQGLTAENSEIAASLAAVTVNVSPSNAIRYLGFNLNREPMSEPSFRTALATLLDRERLVAEITGFPTPAYSFVNPANPRWFDAAAAEQISAAFSGDLAARLENAVRLLTDAGYQWDQVPSVGADGHVSPGTSLTINGVPPAPLTILTPGDAYDPHRPRYAAEIAEILGWLGFNAVPIETDFDTVVDLAFTPGDDGRWRYDMYLLGWTLGSPALPDYYRHLFARDGQLNNTGYASAVFEEQLARYEGAYTYEEAFAALWELEATLAADLPYLLLYTSPIAEAYRSDRITYSTSAGLGGLQGRLGGIRDVSPVG
ncbi:MAG: ABC transporter substrate-binding protein [Acidimicrobiia bacterium]|nr:ABC transporter substrate-binding protein [Acidimicrobiia bacterium]